MAKVQAGTASDKSAKDYNVTTTKANINASNSIPELRAQVAYLADMVNTLIQQINELKNKK